jgi:hypothetical protein
MRISIRDFHPGDRDAVGPSQLSRQLLTENGQRIRRLGRVFVDGSQRSDGKTVSRVYRATIVLIATAKEGVPTLQSPDSPGGSTRRNPLSLPAMGSVSRSALAPPKPRDHHLQRSCGLCTPPRGRRALLEITERSSLQERTDCHHVRVTVRHRSRGAAAHRSGRFGVDREPRLPRRSLRLTCRMSKTRASAGR